MGCGRKGKYLKNGSWELIEALIKVVMKLFLSFVLLDVLGIKNLRGKLHSYILILSAGVRLFSERVVQMPSYLACLAYPQ